jgi:hypothetical protein
VVVVAVVLVMVHLGTPVVRVALEVVAVVAMQTQTELVEHPHNRVRIVELLQMPVLRVVRVPQALVTAVEVVVVLVKSEILFKVILRVMDTIYKVVTV